MQMREVAVTEEYLEHLIEQLKQWAQLETSLALPQFFKQERLGYPYFKYLTSISPKLNNEFEVAKASLATRWMALAMDNKKLPAHQLKVLMRYLRFYDSHVFDLETEARGAVAQIGNEAIMSYIADHYGDKELDAAYAHLYSKQSQGKRG